MLEVVQATIKIECREQLRINAHRIIPSHVILYEDESDFRENYTVNMLGLLPPNSESKASW